MTQATDEKGHPPEARKSLLATLRRLQIERLGCDERTGARYAIGFTESGEPYRAFLWNDEREDGYELAS